MLKKIKKIKDTQLELLCEASLEEIAPCLNKATKRISQNIKISGFRPGKVPYEIVKKEVGEMDIYQEALDEIISQNFFKIVKEEKLKVIKQPKIDIQVLIPGQPIVYKATVNLLPKVKLSDYKKIQIKKPQPEIKSRHIDDILKDLQKKRAKEVLVNRTIQKGDKINVDIEMFSDKVPIEDGQIKSHSIIVGEPFFIPGFNENLIGSKEGEVKEFELKMPENYYNKNLADRMVSFKVKINSIHQMDLPELNDEFAKELGQFESLEKLTKQIKENLETEETHKIEEKCEGDILDKLIYQSSFEEISDDLIETEIDKIFFELEQTMMNQGMEIKDYLAHLKKTKEDLKKDFRPLAIKRIKSILIIQEIAENEMIQPSELEITTEINNLLKIYPTDKKIRERIQSEEYKKLLEDELINKRVLDFLKKTCLL